MMSSGWQLRASHILLNTSVVTVSPFDNLASVGEEMILLFNKSVFSSLCVSINRKVCSTSCSLYHLLIYLVYTNKL